MPVLFLLRLLCHELVVMTCACNSVHMQPRLSNPADVYNHSACVQLFIRQDSPVCGGLSFSAAPPLAASRSAGLVHWAENTCEMVIKRHFRALCVNRAAAAPGRRVQPVGTEVRGECAPADERRTIVSRCPVNTTIHCHVQR
jgi:hypothetical protein